MDSESQTARDEAATAHAHTNPSLEEECPYSPDSPDHSPGSPEPGPEVLWDENQNPDFQRTIFRERLSSPREPRKEDYIWPDRPSHARTERFLHGCSILLWNAQGHDKEIAGKSCPERRNELLDTNKSAGGGRTGRHR
eukprot:657090-Prorocentrum_minimum.AAC.1